MVGTEAERQFYLAAAGIRMWYAREPLPGAAPSGEFNFAEFDAAPVPISEPESTAAQPSGKTERSKDHIAKLQSLMEKKSPEPEPVPANVPVSTLSQQDAVPEVESPQEEASVPASGPVRRGIPRVTLQTWVGQEVMLIAELSDESTLALQQTLARNIFKALGESSPETLDIVRWPLFNNAGVSLNDVSHLMDLLSSQLEAREDKVVVTLGEGGNWLDASLGRQPDVYFAATLANLAGTPALKRELWQRLKPFRRDLS